MVVEAGQQFNFTYVLPGEGPVQLAVDAALSMGWCNSPSFFCTATKSGCILAYRILDSDTQQLPHSLEHRFFPAALPREISLSLSAWNNKSCFMAFAKWLQAGGSNNGRPISGTQVETML
jgi:hypothetical protein